MASAGLADEIAFLGLRPSSNWGTQRQPWQHTLVAARGDRAGRFGRALQRQSGGGPGRRGLVRHRAVAACAARPRSGHSGNCWLVAWARIGLCGTACNSSTGSGPLSPSSDVLFGAFFDIDDERQRQPRIRRASGSSAHVMTSFRAVSTTSAASRAGAGTAMPRCTAGRAPIAGEPARQMGERRSDARPVVLRHPGIAGHVGDGIVVRPGSPARPAACPSRRTAAWSRSGSARSPRESCSGK